MDVYNQPPAALGLQIPGAGAVVYDSTPTFAWDAAADPDPGASQTYTLVLAADSGFTYKAEASGITATSYDWPRWPNALSTGINYYWKVRVDDGRGGEATSAASSFRIISLGDENGDGTVNVLDVVMLINFVFRGGLPPNPKSIGDVSGDCVTNVLDFVYLIGHVYRSGPAPLAGCACAL